MKVSAFLTVVVLTATAAAQSVSTDEAYQRLQQRLQEKQAVAATQPAADQIAALQTENSRLRSIIADLQLQLDALKQPGAGAVPAAPAPVAAYAPPPTYTTPNASRGYVSAPATQPQADRPIPPNGDQATGQTTATGIPTYVGPRGGVYHYSKNGNKVYEKRK